MFICVFNMILISHAGVLGIKPAMKINLVRTFMVTRTEPKWG